MFRIDNCLPLNLSRAGCRLTSATTDAGGRCSNHCFLYCEAEVRRSLYSVGKAPKAREQGRGLGSSGELSFGSCERSIVGNDGRGLDSGGGDCFRVGRAERRGLAVDSTAGEWTEACRVLGGVGGRGLLSLCGDVHSL